MFFGKTVIPSEKNGPIDVRYTFGKAEVYVAGYDQSTAYIITMWKKALAHIPRSCPIKNILMLGLGGGSAVHEIQKRFPECTLTVVEWDPAMITLYKQLHPKNNPITILQGDAMLLVPALKETFDLVVVDLFKGNQTPEALASHEMVSAIAHVTTQHGLCLLNAFISLNLPAIFDTHFTRDTEWIYRYNHLFLYSK